MLRSLKQNRNEVEFSVANIHRYGVASPHFSTVET